MQKLSTEDFVVKSRQVHGDTYNYTKSVYTKTTAKLIIICAQHGEFNQQASEHLQGRGCRKCAQTKLRQLTSKSPAGFLADAREIHGDTYDYSKTQYKNNATKVSIICQEHGEFSQTPTNHLKGQGCKKCAVDNLAKTLRITVPEFITRAREVHGEKYDYSNLDIRNLNEKTTFVCSLHGSFEQKPAEHLRGRGCQKCLKESNRLKQWEAMHQKFISVHSERYNYSKVHYINARLPVNIVCKQHGEFSQTPDSHSAGANCPQCSTESRVINSRTPWQEALDSLPDDHRLKYTYEVTSEPTIRMRKKIKITCPTHGEFWQTLNLHRRTKHACQACWQGTKFLTTQEFISKAIAVHGNAYDYSKTEYVESKAVVSIGCPEHGEFQQQANSHLNGSGCQKCANNGTSKAEKDIKEFLETLGLDVKAHDRTVLDGLEIDLIVGNVGIEYNGLYWHSEEYGKDKHYHKDKTAKAAVKGVSLIHIMEDEWKTKPDIVKARLSAKFGKSFRRFARKLEVREVSWSQAKTFYEKYHLQGAGIPGGSLGLYDKDDLVACLTTGRRSDAFELLRYATVGTVVGGFSKLFKQCCSKYSGVNRIISYSDLRWGSGDVYGKNGFTRLKDTPPGYSWSSKGVRFSREKFQKHKLAETLETFDPAKTEVQNMHDNGYFRIFDCGHAKWEWTRDNG